MEEVMVLAEGVVDEGGFFDLRNLKQDRIAAQCVCCGSDQLDASPAILMPFVADRAFGWKPVAIDDSWGLDTIPNGYAFSICNSLQCRDCEHLFCDIRFSDAEMSALYDHYRGDEYSKLREFYEPGYILRNTALSQQIAHTDKIENFLRPQLRLPVSILDWGGDTGKNAPFKSENKVLHVYDISHQDVIAGAQSVTWEDATSRRYDLIVCTHVLEHVPYPSEVLFDIKRVMDENSILYIELPYENFIKAGGPDLYLRKRHWHEHINFYNEKSLTRLLTNCGLSIVDIQNPGVNISGASAHSLFQVACKIGSP